MSRDELTHKTEQYKADKKEFYRNVKWMALIVITYVLLKWIE